MLRKPIQLMAAAVLIALGVCYGIEMASGGIERVNGPMQPGAAATAATADSREVKPDPKPQPAPSTNASISKPAEKAPETSGAATEEPEVGGLNKLAGKTGDLLQIVSRHSIDWVVSLFDKIVN